MIVAIDPGTTGCIAILSPAGTLVDFCHMPIAKIGKRNRVNAAAIWGFLAPYADQVQHAYIEKVQSMPGQGVASMFSFGHAGDGNIHVSLAAKHGNTPSKNVTAARHAVLKEAVALEGRIAAEHGIGMVKRNKIGWNIDHGTLSFMKNLKDLLDPHHILNPGKVL